MKRLTTLFLCSLALHFHAQGQTYSIAGSIRSAKDGMPLAGAVLHNKIAKSAALTDGLGHFLLSAQGTALQLRIQLIGFESKDTTIRLPQEKALDILLEQKATALQEVTVSTGYQRLPKERATGSFVQVDSSLFNRRAGPDVLGRLADVVPGLTFNREANGLEGSISIRGQGTILSDAQPLIVLDNFPYDGDIRDINPNDVASVTVLKDAAAASIWGARAANGVIVISTKKGSYRTPTTISFNSNLTLKEKPDLYDAPQMSSADYIATERALFAQGFYSSAENSYNHAPLSPVVELLIAQRDGLPQGVDAEAKIAALAAQDVRKDVDDYFYRNSLSQQYALSVQGGSEKQRFLLSGGYDRNPESLIGNAQERYTLNASHSFSLLKGDRLKINSALYYVKSRTTQNNPGPTGITFGGMPLYPYAQLADGAGDALPIYGDYRQSFVAAAQDNGKLDWTYRPLEELALADHDTRNNNYRLNIGANYRILPFLSAEVLYQYGQGRSTERDEHSMDSYFSRNLINNFSAMASNGTWSYPVPLGAILDNAYQESTLQNLRGQLNLDWQQGPHRINAIAGAERREQHSLWNTYRLYGYDEAHETSKAVDYVNRYPSASATGANIAIPYQNFGTDLSDRNLSYYGNAAYAYQGKYTASASIRLDQSNLFGVKANQKGVPLYSLGVGWLLSSEAAYPLAWLPYAKLRATYGYNGNINKSVTAYTTARYNSGSSTITKLPYAEIVNAPNPELRWERVKVVNLGLDFALQGQLLNGSIEYYVKKGTDLIGLIPYAASSGITQFTGNTAAISGKGLDLKLALRPLKGSFQWQADLLLAYNSDKVTSYALSPSAERYLTYLNTPFEGRPLYGVYSYPWAGLDPQTGDPQGYLNGEVSTDYSAIRSAYGRDSLQYHGSARPKYFGSFIHTFSWKQFSLSANISYRFAYYFRRNSIVYGNNMGLGGHGDYARRWQQPGDEAFTDVPSIPSATNANRDFFYTYSAALVERGDHIRLQDLTLSYSPGKQLQQRLGVNNLRIYLFADNLGILWKASKGDIDPDYPYNRPQRSIAAGLSLNF